MSMKSRTIIILTFLFAGFGCTGTTGGRNQVAVDSTRIADSTAAAAVPSKPPLSYEERQGSYIYAKYCAVCHGQEGKGDGFNAFNLDPRPRDFTDTVYMKALGDDQIVQTISGGGRSVNKSPLMPAYGWTLDKQQIRYTTEYIRALGGP